MFKVDFRKEFVQREKELKPLDFINADEIYDIDDNS